MKPYIWTLLLSIVGVTLYNVSAKLVPRDLNPMFLLAVVYGLGTVLCLVAGYFFPGGLAAAVRQLNWPMLGLALSVVLIEVGYVLTYRSGGHVAIVPILVSTGAMLALLPLSILVFHEQVTAKNIMGIGLCLLGLWLATSR